MEARSIQERRGQDWVGDDVVGTDHGGPGRLASRWSDLPPRRRRALVLVLVLVVCAAAVAWAVDARRGWLAEQALDDEVSVSASLGVSSSSTTPAGGSVDFYLALANVGAGPVTITAADITTGRFRITNGEIRLPTVQPGDTLLVPLSVLLDCTGDPDDGGLRDLPGLVRATPVNGREREVAVRVQSADVVTGIADTLCPLRPDLRNFELDGPVL